MSETTPPNEPQLPNTPQQPASPPPSGGQPPRPPYPAPGYDPGDNTGAGPFPGGSPAAVGTSFFKALFDFSFTTFITRKLASVFYIIGLVVIAIVGVVWFFAMLIGSFSAFNHNAGAGFLGLLVALIAVPIATFLSIVVLRFWIEAVVALIAVAENTERTAENTRRR